MEVLLDPRTVNSRKVLAGLKLTGADYTVRKYDYFQAEQKSEEFVAVNPNAAFPALIAVSYTHLTLPTKRIV